MSVPAKAGVSYTVRFVGTKRDFEAGVKGTVRFAGEPEQGIGARDYPLYSDAIGVTLKSVVGKPGEAYGLSAHQHPRRKMAWTQPLRRP